MHFIEQIFKAIYNGRHLKISKLPFKTYSSEILYSKDINLKGQKEYKPGGELRITYVKRKTRRNVAYCNDNDPYVFNHLKY